MRTSMQRQVKRATGQYRVNGARGSYYVSGRKKGSKTYVPKENIGNKSKAQFGSREMKRADLRAAFGAQW